MFWCYKPQSSQTHLPSATWQVLRSWSCWLLFTSLSERIFSKALDRNMLFVLLSSLFICECSGCCMSQCWYHSPLMPSSFTWSWELSSKKKATQSQAIGSCYLISTLPCWFYVTSCDTQLSGVWLRLFAFAWRCLSSGASDFWNRNRWLTKINNTPLTNQVVSRELFSQLFSVPSAVICNHDSKPENAVFTIKKKKKISDKAPQFAFFCVHDFIAVSSEIFKHVNYGLHYALFKNEKSVSCRTKLIFVCFL